MGKGRRTTSAAPVVLIHGDLNPTNVLLTSRGPVLFDWANYEFGRRGVDPA